MELTREEVCKYAVFATDKDVSRFAKALLAEMDKPGVWDNAPKDATFASVNYCPEQGRSYKLADKHYSFYRELPKSRIDEIAEEVGTEKAKEYNWNHVAKQCAIDIAKSAILKDREEMEACR